MTGPRARPAAESSAESATERPLLSELWHTKAWRLFPLLLAYMAGVTLLIPHVPGIMTDYFAGRRAGHNLHCEGMAKDAPDAAACRDAHADVVMWSSWTSFFSNSFVSIVLTPLLGHWSDLHGRKPFFLVAQACSCIPLTIVLLHLTSGLPLLWYYVVQIFLSAVSSVTVSLSFIADSLSPRNRAACFGLIMACFSVAIFIGPPVGAMLPPLTAALGALGTVVGCALYTLLVLPESLTPEAKAIAQRRHREQQHSQRQGGGRAMHPALGSTLRAVRILMRSPLFKRLTVTMMITGVVLEGLQDLLVQYLQLKLEFGVADVSKIFMIFGGCGLLVQTIVLRTLLGWMGEQRVLLVALLASAGQQLLLAVAGHKWMAFLGISLGSLGSMSFPTISSIKSCNAAEHEQGSVQGALYGARALASGTGPLVFAFLFSAFTQTGSPLPYFPGAPFIFGVALMLVAVGVAATIPATAGSHRPATAGDGDGDHAQQHEAVSSGPSPDPGQSRKGKHAAAGWPAGEEEAQPSGRASRGSVDLEGGGPGQDGPTERTRLLD